MHRGHCHPTIPQGPQAVFFLLMVFDCHGPLLAHRHPVRQARPEVALEVQELESAVF